MAWPGNVSALAKERQKQGVLSFASVEHCGIAHAHVAFATA